MENVIDIKTKKEIKPSKLFRKWNSILDKKVLSKSEVGAFCARLNNLQKTNLTLDEIRVLYSKFETKVDQFEGYSITDEHTEQGYEYLWRTFFKKNGEIRDTKDLFIGDFEANVLRNFNYFKLVGVRDCSLHGLNSQYKPVWRVVSKDGECFEYCNPHQWSTPEIVGVKKIA